MPDEYKDRFDEVVVSAEGYKKYCFEYRFKDQLWAFTIWAEDEEEALERVHSLALYGRLMGEEMFSLRAPRGFGWLVNIICRIRNWLFV